MVVLSRLVLALLSAVASSAGSERTAKTELDVACSLSPARAFTGIRLWTQDSLGMGRQRSAPIHRGKTSFVVTECEHGEIRREFTIPDRDLIFNSTVCDPRLADGYAQQCLRFVRRRSYLKRSRFGYNTLVGGIFMANCTKYASYCDWRPLYPLQEDSSSDWHTLTRGRKAYVRRAYLRSPTPNDRAFTLNLDWAGFLDVNEQY